MAHHERKHTTDTSATFNETSTEMDTDNNGNQYPTVSITCESGFQTAALLIEEYEEMHFIEWKTTGEREFVEAHRVLRPRNSSPCETTDALPVEMERTALDSHNDDDNDDEEVQLVLTILPPSPAKPKASPVALPHSQPSVVVPVATDPTKRSNYEDGTGHPSEDACTTSSDAHDRQSLDQSKAPNRTLWPEKPSLQEFNSTSSIHHSDDPNVSIVTDEAISTGNGVENHRPDNTTGTNSSIAPVTPQRSPPFSSRTSAYLQSLAEICHAILWDVRWRVGGTRQERLFTWERGHDLSAVHALARRYLPLPPPPPISICYCLFCNQDNPSCEPTNLTKYCTHDIPSGEPLVANDHPHGTDTSTDPENSNPPLATSSLDESSSPTATEDDNDEAYDRALNLYARLYSRKGPWFRVDDLFKYYVPKRRSEVAAATKQDSPVKPISPSKFFLPKSAQKPIVAKSMDAYIDQDHVNRQLEAVTVLLQDLQELFRMGLLRSFQSEQECGQTTGQVAKYGLLRQDEQLVVLKKLGGGGSRQSPKQATTNKPSKKAHNGENLLWKQMCQQQSILPKGPDHTINNTVLLPVAKHVDQTLIATWANNIVLRSTRVNYIPQSILRLIVGPIQQTLQQMLHDTLDGGHVSCMCLRLREAPLQTLQRCCRLYLCATSGPGDMRGDTGTNAWKNLPHEVLPRHDETTQNPFITNSVAPPHSPNWHHTIIPGRDYRFKLISCAFRRAHQPLVLDEPSPLVQSLTESEIHHIQVFPNVASFELWELSVTFRSIVDYLLEANELALYTERKRARVEANIAKDEDRVKLDNSQSTPNLPLETKDVTIDQNLDSPVDFLNLLQQPWRNNILNQFSNAMALTPRMKSKLQDQVEINVRALLDVDDKQFKNDCERVLAIIAVLSTNVLWIRNHAASEHEIHRVVSRPWLRHLWWEGCIAYLLWDIIPILERRGFYELATHALEILLFGRYQPRNPGCSTIPVSLVATTGSFLAQAYLSRRARGKAYERLVVDYMHILRHQQKKRETKKVTTKVKRKRNHSEATSEPLSANDITAKLCQELIDSTLPTGQITFCAARTLARRMKQPLTATLCTVQVYEVQELGHRLESNGDTEQSHHDPPTTGDKKRKCIKKYSDWSPITDHAVANAMVVDGQPTIGTRCSYVGFEEQQESPASFTSLNVEQLALEYYNSGRLPETQDSSDLRGGWVGWHDEGGKLRALFRILSSMTVLGTDWNCPRDNRDTIENASIHLTPYQGAPFDLHVGAEHASDHRCERLGFYARRKVIIDRFLNKLEMLDPIQLAHLVHGSIAARWHYARKTRQMDPTVERDIEQARTLAALAAGFGGKMLSAMCRCLYFDYRHYSGGLPDLTLFRAVYERDAHHDEETLVDLGSWVGEEFDPAIKAEREAKNAASMLEDRDEEFLGCSKVGDSGRRTNRIGGRPAQTSRLQDDSHTKMDLKLPDRLVFQHNGRNVRVDCMLVEVKSHNDRLDPRQEDWLNVLDRYGNVRVCKFTAKTKDKKAAGLEPPPSDAT